MGDAQSPSGPLNSTQMNHTPIYSLTPEHTQRDTSKYRNNPPNLKIFTYLEEALWKAKRLCALISWQLGPYFTSSSIFFLSKYSWLYNTVFSFLELMMSSEMAHVYQHWGRKMKCCYLSTEGKCFLLRGREGRELKLRSSHLSWVTI